MMKASGRFNFVGNVESSHIFSGKVADVIVCDGFTGKVILKMAEGLYRINNALGGNNNKFWEAMNYEHVGGTPVLGVGAPVIIGHGCSSPLAIRSMILSTEHTAKADVGMMMSRFGLTPETINWVIPHEANRRIIEAVAKRAEIPLEKVIINIDRYGNTSAATIPLAMWDNEKLLKKGDNVIFLTLRNTIRRCLADDRYDAFPFDGSRFLLRPHGIESIGSDTDQTAVAPCPIGVEIIADLRSLQYGYAQRRDRTGIIGTEIDDRHLALRIGARSVLGSRSGHRQFAVGIGDLPLVGFGDRILDHALRLDLETLGLAVGEIGQCRSAFDAQIEIRTLSQLDHRPGFVVERDVDIGVVIRDAFEKRGILQCRHRFPSLSTTREEVVPPS